jgi:hypothetical protein
MHPTAGEFFQIISSHGTVLASEIVSGELACRREGDMNFQWRRLIGYVSPLRPDAIFLIADPNGSGRLVIPPGLDCEALLPLGLSWPGAQLKASFYDPETGQWACAAPFHDGSDFGEVAANRDTIGAWEEFDLVPIRSAYVPAETISLVSRLNKLLCKPLSVETVLAALAQDGPILQAIARLMPYDSLDQLARALLTSPEACRKLAQLFPRDVLGVFGLPTLGAWVSEGRKPLPQPTTLGVEIDPTPTMAHIVTKKHVSLPSICTALARRAVEPQRNVCVIATARNEGPYLLDWIAYHRAIGIESFFLYSNDNDDGSDDLLLALARAGAIHWTDSKVPIGGFAQAKAYAHALAICPDVLDYRWVLVIDLDEYFVLNPARFRSMVAYLHWQEASPVDAIALNWIVHGPSGSGRWRDDFVVRRFPNPNDIIDPHIKCLFRARKFIYSHAHYPFTLKNEPFVFKNSSGDIYVSRPDDPGYALSQNPTAEYAWINHYYFKSSEEYLLKLSRNRGDNPTLKAPSNSAMTTSDLYNFMHHFSIVGKLRANPEDAAQGYEAELARLMRLPGVEEAFERVKLVHATRLKEVVSMFLDAPAIIETGSVGQAFDHGPARASKQCDPVEMRERDLTGSAISVAAVAPGRSTTLAGWWQTKKRSRHPGTHPGNSNNTNNASIRCIGTTG